MKRARPNAAALKAAEPVLRNYVLAIERKNLTGEKQIARLQAEVVTQQHKILALKAELKNLARKTGLKLSITFAGDKPKVVPSPAGSSTP